MARRNKAAKRTQNVPDFEEELDEVDAFHKNQEEILLNEATGGVKGNDGFSEEEFSDEDVLGLSQEDSDEEPQEDQEEFDSDEEYYGIKKTRLDANLDDEGEDGWGTSKNNYYGADEIDDEEAAKEEEKEALRIQKKHLEQLKLQDYFDEDDEQEWTEAVKKEDVLAVVGDASGASVDQDPTFLNPNERLELLKSAYPEVIPLSEELLSLKEQLEAMKAQQHSGGSASELSSIKFAALSCYIATIYSYFALFVNKLDKGKVDLKGHAVMEGILKARTVWQMAQKARDVKTKEGKQQANGDIDMDVDIDIDAGTYSDSGSDKNSSLDGYSSEEESGSGSGSDSELENTDEFAVERLQAVKKHNKHLPKNDDDEQEMDIEEKEARKRSLRFYTSKIDQKTQKINQRYGGDDDLPYKERHFERQKRLMEEARLRGLKTGEKDEADDFSSDSADEGDDVGDGSRSDDDIYESVKQKAEMKKLARKQAHEAAVQAAKEGRLEQMMEELADEGSKRAVSYQILKNKGLTAKRNKDNRNPRVKKRKKYEAAKKKMKSVRSVYQQPTTAYGGEQTGIKKNLVKSVKFRS